MHLKMFLCPLLLMKTTSFTRPVFSLTKTMGMRFIHMRNSRESIETMKEKKSSSMYKPKTKNQETYVKYLQDEDVKILLSLGPAGTGKTLFACNAAVHELKNKNIERIILTRPIVPVEEEEIGFLPGSLISKMDPWTRPLFDILSTFYTKTDLQTMMKEGIIEISPLAFMRGRTFKDAFIIADEMQNSTPNQMIMLTTRIGENSKLVITGDLKQSDIREKNGLHDLIEKIDSYSTNGHIEGIKYIRMKEVDIQRSPVVNTILKIYENSKHAKSLTKYIPVTESDIVQPLVNKEDDTRERIKMHVNTTLLRQDQQKNINTVNNDAAMIPKTHVLEKYPDLF